MTAGQGLWIAVNMTILVVMMVAMAGVMIFVLINLKNTITKATDNVQNQVKNVTDRANTVIDQVQTTVLSVSTKVAVAERAINAMTNAVSGAKVVKSAKRVADNSAGIASRVLSGVMAGLDNLMDSDKKGKEDHKDA